MIAEQETYKGYEIEIHYDEDAQSPREFDNLGTLIWWHRGYSSPDTNDFEDVRDMISSLSEIHLDDLESKRMDWDETKEKWCYDKNKQDVYYDDHNFFKYNNRWYTEEQIVELQRKEVDKNYVMLPIYMYDHSGITINTSGFSCSWDSGQVGFIYVDKKKLLDECYYDQTIKPLSITKKAREYAERVLTQEVKTFDDYLTGNVHFYTVEKDGEVIDSCGGYYGEIDYCLSEAKSTVDWQIKANHKSKLEQLKIWIKNRVPFGYRTFAID